MTEANLLASPIRVRVTTRGMQGRPGVGNHNYASFAEFDAAITGFTFPIGTLAFANGLSFIYLGVGVTSIPARPGWAPFGEESLWHYKPVLDGVADDTAAAQAMINHAGRLVIPKKRTLRCAGALTIPAGLTEVEIAGGGRGAKLFYDPALAVNFFNEANYAGTKLKRFVVRDLDVESNHATNLSWLGAYPLRVTAADDVEFNNVGSSYSRVMGIMVRGAKRAKVHNCEVHHCARDGINLADCIETIVTTNRVHHNDDDAIAIHNTHWSWQRGHVITGNNVSFGQGIRALGVNNIAIAGNTLQFIIKDGICVDASSFDGGVKIEGVNATLNVSITGNVMADMFNRTFIDAVNGGADYISVKCNSAQMGSLAAVPGTMGTTPYGYYQNVKLAAENLATTPIPASGGIVISGNTMKRTLPRTGLFSAQGFGKFWLRGGEYDYDLSNDTNANFISLSGYINGLIIANNYAEGEDRFMYVGLDDGVVRPIHNASVRGNIVVDIAENAVVVATTTETLDIEFSGNTFDLDPYHLHANRGATGGWLAVGAPQVAALQGARGTAWRDNDFKNMARFGTSTLATYLAAGDLAFAGNRFWGQPVVTGFSTSNKGVGQVEGIAGQQSVHIECDPASADHGRVIRQAAGGSAAQPATGSYMAGEFVAKTVPNLTGANALRGMIMGWQRLTTGSAHVAGVDWVEVQAMAPANALVTLNALAIAAGGGNGVTVNQATDKTTAVTANGQSGLINLAASSLAAGQEVEFEVNNSAIVDDEIPYLLPQTSSTAYEARIIAWSTGPGRFRVAVKNRTGGALAQAFPLRFILLGAPNN